MRQQDTIINKSWNQEDDKMETAKICNLYTLEETIAKDLFEGAVYPWECFLRLVHLSQN